MHSELGPGPRADLGCNGPANGTCGGSGNSSRAGPGPRDRSIPNDGGGGAGDDFGGLPEVESQAARSGPVARYRQDDLLPEAPGDGPRSLFSRNEPGTRTAIRVNWR